MFLGKSIVPHRRIRIPFQLPAKYSDHNNYHYHPNNHNTPFKIIVPDISEKSKASVIDTNVMYFFTTLIGLGILFVYNKYGRYKS